MAGTGRLYVIGDRETGVLFVKTNPLRASIVPISTIEQYASSHNITVDEAFAKVGKSAKSVIIDGDLESTPVASEAVFEAFYEMIKNGTNISDADFCFIAQVRNDGWVDRRYSYPPAGPAFSLLNPDTSKPNGDLLPEAELMDGRP